MRLTNLGYTLEYKIMNSEFNLFKEPIPKIIHYIWLCSDDKPVTIENRFLYYRLKENLKKLPKSDNYQHKLWTNIPDIINAQVIESRMDGLLKVESIYNHQNDLQLFYSINQILVEHCESKRDFVLQNLIEIHGDYFNIPFPELSLIPTAQQIGVAVDMLKYSIAFKEGGIIADLNFVFENAPSIEMLINNDFISIGNENGFFLSIKNNPILNIMMNLYEMYFDRSPYMDANGYYNHVYSRYLSDIYKNKKLVGIGDKRSCDYIYPEYQIEGCIGKNLIGVDGNEGTWS
jgi:hypothetical protein